ncbi:NAD(P)/FAD-dependent oxidoreductase [Patulibacter americanus]|uniref:NAD(P)/FAD-dependent oxidoreductase n=1 Tax=Patulibacter americanus TaxID=588672 RepID=UPI0003B387C6|nr:FAD-binding oxidoreductase [Patulibacter americanus]
MTGTPEWDVIVVGAGICGLAAADELARGGARVLVLDRRGIGMGQSQGLARIFRVRHAQARLCTLALESRDGWRAWEERLGVGRLLGAEGLVAVGSGGGQDGRAMDEAGAPWEPVDRTRMGQLVPHLDASTLGEEGLFDPSAGAIRVRRTLDALAAGLDVRVGDVVAVDQDDDRATVRLGDGTALHAGRVLLCAGSATPHLARAAGLPDIELTETHHVRLTYRRRAPERSTACLSTDVAYALPLGSTGLWGLGFDFPDLEVPVDEPIEPFLAENHRRHAAWVPEHLPGLDPVPVGEVRCVSPYAPWIDGHGDGFAAARRDRVVAFCGSNLMKFAPLLADRLAWTVRDEAEVHPDLRPVTGAATA